MKLTDAQKQADSAIRAFNKQLEQAYTKLGYDHTVTRNLVSTARVIFGKDAIKTMNTKYVDKKNIDYSTGEYYETIQVKRSKDVLNKTIDNNLIKQLDKTLRFKNNTQNRDLDKYNGTYKSMFNVSNAYNKAVEQVRMFHQTHLPQHIRDALNNTTSISEKNKILESYQKSMTTTDNIDIQIFFNDLSSEVFAAYNQARNEIEDESDYTETFLKMQEFANAYNSNNYNMELLQQARRARDNFIYSQQYRDELEQISGNTFDQYDDLNIF